MWCCFGFFLKGEDTQDVIKTNHKIKETRATKKERDKDKL
jgi:hypothetical protein